MLIRTVLLLSLAACGHVQPQGAPDAAPDSSSAPDALTGCPTHVANPMPPMWVNGAGFALVDDPDRTHPIVWASNGAARSGSFAVAFADGDRITGLSFEVRGNGAAGLKNIAVTYAGQTLATGSDQGRAAQWGSVALPVASPTVLAGGQLLVTFDVVGTGYLIGQVTAELERACR